MESGGNGAAMSVLGMFASANAIVQVVMVALLFASLVVWTVLIAKVIDINQATRRLNTALSRLRAAETLAGVEPNLGSPIAAALVAEAADEVAASHRVKATGSMMERVAIGLDRLMVGEARRIGNSIGIIGSIASTAPFVGLFGTVWGIMNSFVGIAKSHTTNLAVVAPGIAEALLATACGLVVAIPAVVIYNILSRRVGGYRALVADAAAMVTRLASREIDLGASATN